MDSPGRRGVWFRWLVAHAAVVVVCTLAFWLIVVATPPEAGFNFGVIFVALPLMALGLPWTMFSLVDPYQLDGLPVLLRSVLEFGPAYLNVAIHGALVWLISGRRGQRDSSTADPSQG